MFNKIKINQVTIFVGIAHIMLKILFFSKKTRFLNSENGFVYQKIGSHGYNLLKITKLVNLTRKKKSAIMTTWCFQ